MRPVFGKPIDARPVRRAVERLARDGVGDVMDVADDLGDGGAVRLPALADEEGDEAAVAGVEVEMRLLRHVEIRLLEDERHAEDALVEVDRVLPVRPDQGDVVDPGRGDFHVSLPLLAIGYWLLATGCWLLAAVI